VRRSNDEITTMRRAGRVVAEMHARIRDAIRPGVTTRDLDRIGREVIERNGARSNFLGYGPFGMPPFPGVICTSPNSVIVHGIPDDTRLEEGDVISIDAGAIVGGYHGDAAYTWPVGSISSEAEKLLRVTEESLKAGIDQLRDGNRLSDIGHAVQTVAEGAGFSVVKEYEGHAIGTAMHEKPGVPNYGPPGRGMKLRPGHVFAVEPMVNLGGAATRVLADQWTVVTADGSLSAHFEHTIAVTPDGPEVLTLL
jgi:methionyl aminopeptidase